MSSSSILGILVALVVIVGGAYWWVSANPDAMSGGNTAVNEGASSDAAGGTFPEGSTENDTPDTPINTVPTTATITYDGSKFSPASVTIKKGGTVLWNNETSGKMWVASAQHPTHTVYGGTSRSEHCATSYTGAKPFDQCVGGNNFSFKFDKLGTFNYHDHINASAFGSVTVVE